MRYSSHFSRAILSSIGWWIGVAISVGFYFATAGIVENSGRQHFEQQANNAQHAIEVRIADYADVIFGLRALFQSSDTVSRLQFHRYVVGLDLAHRYPGIQSLNFAQHVLARDKARFESQIRQDTSVEPAGYPDFAIKPPGDRPEYNVLIYVEPMHLNPASFALDISSNPVVAAALAKSRDTGSLTSSGRLIRVEGPSKHVALAMRLPFYRNGMSASSLEERRAAYAGSVGAGFNLQKLLNGALDDPSARYLHFRLYDIDADGDGKKRESGTTDPQFLLFENGLDTAHQSERSEDVFSTRIQMELGGRTWESHFTAKKSVFINGIGSYLPWLAFSIGMFATILLFSIFYSLNSSRQRALEMARAMTKDLRESEASLADAQQMAHLGNWLLDPSTGHMTWSAETFNTLGLEPAADTPAYACFMGCIHADDRASLHNTLERSADTGREFSAEYRVMHKTGIRWVQIISRPGIDQQKGMLRGTIMDIDERKRFEETLHEKNVELEKSNLAKDRFLANMSHELRTPLNAIIGFTGTLLMRLAGPLSFEQDKQLNTIKSSARHLLSLINDMLDLTKIESGKVELNLESVVCQGLLQELAETLRPMAEKKGLGFKLELPADPLVMRTDRRAFSQIMINLINNAIKFTESGSIHIVLSKHTSDNRQALQIDVIDTGVGIKPEDQAKLFQAFTQLDAALTRRFEGAGLGLHLSQKLAGLIGGRISVRSEYGSGSVFSLILNR